MKIIHRYLKFLSIACIAMLYWADSYAQLQQPNRYEKERKYNDEDFTIIPLKTDGLALIRGKNKYKSGNQTWELIFLDSTLQEKGTVEIEVDIKNVLIGHDHSSGFVHLLFNTNEVRGDMEIISVSLNSHEVVRHEIKPELKLQLTHFSKISENFVFGGIVNMEPAVLLYTPAINHLKVLPGFFQKDAELIDLRVNHNQTFNALLIDRGDHTNRKLVFRTFDPSGNPLLEDITSIDDDIVVLTGMTSTLEREDMMIVGTWGKINSKQASGFYSLTVNPFEEQKIKRIYLGQLAHYLDYLKPKRAALIKEKTAKAIEEGKIPDFTNYVMPYKIVEYDGGFLVLAETYIISGTNNQYYYTPYSYYSPMGGYYPSNRINNPVSPYSNGNNFQNTGEVKTLESVVLAFDPTGTVLWDYSIKLNDVKMTSLEQIGNFYLSTDSLHLLYKKESVLKIKTISLDDNESIERTEQSRLSEIHDEIRSEKMQEGTIKHWFGSSFYVWGYQSIRNRISTEFRTREIFYINKVVVR